MSSPRYELRRDKNRLVLVLGEWSQSLSVPPRLLDRVLPRSRALSAFRLENQWDEYTDFVTYLPDIDETGVRIQLTHVATDNSWYAYVVIDTIDGLYLYHGHIDHVPNDVALSVVRAGLNRHDKHYKATLTFLDGVATESAVTPP